jgi:methyl-accepting chemotaxis protein
MQPFFRRLFLRFAAALVVPALVGWFVSGRFYPLSAPQERILQLAAPLGFALLLVAGMAALARLVAPLRDALARPAGALRPEDRARAALAAMRLPSRLAVTVLGSSTLLTVAAAVAERSAALPLDVVVAGSAAALAFGVMAAMLAYSVAVIEVAPAVEALGPTDVRERGTVAAKVLVACYGVLVVATLLVGAMGYARYRADGDEAHVAMAARSLDAGAQAVRAEGVARGVSFAWRATGAPIVAVSRAGVPLARAGERAGLEDAVAGLPVEPVEGGWIVRRPAADATLVAFVSDAPLRARRQAFWAAAAVLGAVILAAASLVVWYAARTLTVPIRSLGRAADRIASGDLTAAPASVTRDEMGQLAADFRRMAQGLTGLVQDVQAATRSVHEGAREMGEIGERVRGGALEEHDRVVAVNAAVEAMQDSVALVGRGIEGLSEYVSTTSSVVGEMAAALEEVRCQAADLMRTVDSAGGDAERLSHSGRRAQAQLAALNDIATGAGATLDAVSTSLASLQGAADDSEATVGEVAMMADASGMIVEEAVAGIEALRSAVDDAKRRVAALGRRSDDVEQILDFVGEVARRTNLLSLNASIIATQAGEHGKAFAVVADQIRELASQIASSTKSIGDIIRAVRDDVSGTARLIDRGDELAARGLALARNSLGALSDIRAATARGREAAASIQAAVAVHAKSSGAVADLVNSVAQNSRAVAEAIAMVGRSVSSVQSVNRSVGALAERVSRALEDQTGLGRRQLEGLERINGRLAEISRGVEAHEASTDHVRELLAHLTRMAAQHESTVAELAGVADRLGGRSRALADRVGRFKV